MYRVKSSTKNGVVVRYGLAFELVLYYQTFIVLDVI